MKLPTFTETPQGIISGQGEAVKFVYDVYTGKSGKRWLVPSNVPNPADNVYVEGGANSDGFAVATLPFTLTDGSTLELKGPWHSNTQSLYQDTGVDIRDKHLGSYVIGLKRSCDFSVNCYGTTSIHGVLLEQHNAIGRFSGTVAREKAEELANLLHRPIAYWSRSKGGGSSGYAWPEGTNHTDWKEYLINLDTTEVDECEEHY